MKTIIFMVLVMLTFPGCVYKQTTTDHRGVVTDEKYIIKRPVKEFIENVEIE
jgi:hypothetical protein